MSAPITPTVSELLLTWTVPENGDAGTSDSVNTSFQAIVNGHQWLDDRFGTVGQGTLRPFRVVSDPATMAAYTLSTTWDIVAVIDSANAPVGVYQYHGTSTAADDPPWHYKSTGAMSPGGWDLIAPGAALINPGTATRGVSLATLDAQGRSMQTPRWCTAEPTGSQGYTTIDINNPSLNYLGLVSSSVAVNTGDKVLVHASVRLNAVGAAGHIDVLTGIHASTSLDGGGTWSTWTLIGPSNLNSCPQEAALSASGGYLHVTMAAMHTVPGTGQALARYTTVAQLAGTGTGTTTAVTAVASSLYALPTKA